MHRNYCSRTTQIHILINRPRSTTHNHPIVLIKMKNKHLSLHHSTLPTGLHLNPHCVYPPMQTQTKHFSYFWKYINIFQNNFLLVLCNIYSPTTICYWYPFTQTYLHFIPQVYYIYPPFLSNARYVQLYRST